jgi:predicted amidohydrolase YtcJ
MRKLLLIITLPIIFMISSCTDTRQKADFIIYNAKIYTVDENFSLTQSMAIRDGYILATGSDREILDSYNSKNRFDARRRAIYPGFIDAHSHFIGYATNLQRADLRPAASFNEVLDILVEHARTHDTEWLVGRGWDQNQWPEKEFPDNSKLNELFPDKPVLLIRVDGHAVIVNEAAMQRLNISHDHTFPTGEAIRNKDKLTGVFLEHSADMFKNAVPLLSREELTAALKEAESKLVAAGLTSLSDAGLDKEMVMLLDSLYNNDALQIRTYAMLNPNDENMEHFVKQGIYKTDRLNVRSIKLFADGALGSRGARLLETYSDVPGHYGIWVHDADMMRKYAAIAHEYGYQMIIHAIGDAAVQRILDVYEEFLPGKNDLRWRIEHAQVVHPNDFDRFGNFSVIPSIQSIHATSDMRWAIDRLGEERLKNSYAQQVLLEQNGWLPNGTDFPVEDIYPLWTFHAAVFRTDHSGYPAGGFQMENALSREQALRSITIWAAKAAFEENEKGSLEAGKMADFILLDRDIMEATENEVLEASVESVWIGGRLAFEK